MIRYYCDVCHKEIVDSKDKVEIVTGGGVKHLHSRCLAEAINAEIERRTAKAEEPHPAPQPIPDKPKAPKKKAPQKKTSKRLDQGKIDTLKALWESNRSGRRAKPWTLKEMAAEVGTTETTVSNYIKLFESEAKA